MARQETKVIVDGVTETWRLVWRGPPAFGCMDEAEMYCIGFAVGEVGELELVRLRAGSPEERLALGTVQLQHWIRPTNVSKGHAATSDEIRTWPVADVMRLADIDGDGRATEFVVVYRTWPANAAESHVVGISKQSPYLHMFGTVEHPDVPINFSWLNEREMKRTGKATSLIQACYDHGSDVELYWTFRLDAAGFHDLGPTTKSCPPGDVLTGGARKARGPACDACDACYDRCGRVSFACADACANTRDQAARNECLEQCANPHDCRQSCPCDACLNADRGSSSRGP